MDFEYGKIRQLASIDKAVVVANKVVAELDKRDTNVYVTLAKAALWLVALLMAAVVLHCISTGNWQTLTQACQVIVMLAVSVLGFHEYKGSRVLHILRNLKSTDK
jgi:hypothetical protein